VAETLLLTAKISTRILKRDLIKLAKSSKNIPGDGQSGEVAGRQLPFAEPLDDRAAPGNRRRQVGKTGDGVVRVGRIRFLDAPGSVEAEPRILALASEHVVLAGASVDPAARRLKVQGLSLRSVEREGMRRRVPQIETGRRRQPGWVDANPLPVVRSLAHDREAVGQPLGLSSASKILR
jgi:hypothetical protein